MRGPCWTVGLCAALWGSAEPAWAAPPEPVPEYRPKPRERRIELGPDVGVAFEPADDGAGIEYRPGFAWGAHALIVYSAWLGLRPWVRHSAHAVELDQGRLASKNDPGLAQVSFTQPDIDLWVLGVQLEPSLRLARWARVWAAFGVDWGRPEAPQPKGVLAPCAPEQSDCIHTPYRTGVFVELTSSVGATLDLLPDWLVAVASVQYGVKIQQSGSMFDETQAFAQGEMHHLRGLPKMAPGLTLMLGIGFVR